jgi:eukaryotic-like serine/threonine-protein kinase
MADEPDREPRVPPEDETVVLDEWGPETVVVDETETPPPRRPRLGLWPWLLALLVVVLGLVAGAILLARDDDEPAGPTTTAQTTTPAALVAVPDVAGTTSSEATATLRAAGFEVNVEPVPSDRPPGTVVAQNPPPGTKAKKGTSVRINVAQPAQETTPPATSAPAATTAPPATTAPAPQPAIVPDAVGQELADAARAFAGEGLKASVRSVPSNEPAGRVVAQAQPPDTELTQGDTVQLNVSIGPDPGEPVAVPGVTGRRLDEGRDMLERAGFEVLALSLEDEIRREATISSQSPSAEARIPRGALVLLYVA